MLSKILSVFFIIISSASYSIECSYSQIATSLLSGYDSSRSFDQDVYSYCNIAAFYDYYMDRGNGEGGTRLSSFRMTDDTARCMVQVNWYADGFVITEINGSEKGKQTVVYRDKIVGISYPISQRGNDHLIHKYSWGHVHTTGMDRQEIYQTEGASFF